MGKYLEMGTAFLGLGVALGSLLMVLLNSPFMTAEPNLQDVYLWTLGFLLGVFLFGWGLGNLVS